MPVALLLSKEQLNAARTSAPMFQARCHETWFITDWGVPLVIALLLLGLIYLFIYLPATLQQSTGDETVRNLTEKYRYNGLNFAKQD